MPELRHPARPAVLDPVAEELILNEPLLDDGRTIFQACREVLELAGPIGEKQHRRCHVAARVGRLIVEDFDRTQIDIAERLDISVRTVERSYALLRRALGVDWGPAR